MSKELTNAAKLLGKAGGKIGGKIGGRSRSEAKLAAARANGKKGGKPKKDNATVTMRITKLPIGMVQVS